MQSQCLTSGSSTQEGHAGSAPSCLKRHWECASVHSVDNDPLNTVGTTSGITLRSDPMKTETDGPDSVKHKQHVVVTTAVKIEPETVYQINTEPEIHRHDVNCRDSAANALPTESNSGFAVIEMETENLMKYGRKRRSGLKVDKGFSGGVNLRTRSEMDPSEKPHVCKDTGKRSKVSERPKVIHAGEKSYTYRSHSCPDCGKSFRKSGNLKRHQLIHQRIHPKVNTGEEPYSCSECGKCFCHLGNLKQHQLTHTDKSYSCTVCGKIFFRLGTLERHQLLHTGERLYSCNECGKSFTHLGSLHTHQRIHKGGKTYICTECGQRFYRLGSFKAHQRVHTIEKEYTCIICGDSFSHLGHFKQHEQVHTKETLLMP
ncbi:hypothetical protein AAFF_G00271390 [Aldrovandia affinis]|uniref:C2H2-type domain-containing protein n=1 Tax=Aldrovandia affinis TaxID=143900 RepID=A0AAD7W2R5_9TELE|nr:hypothetical protein AAFF_G00271390 [Aldrovandia affinis]